MSLRSTLILFSRNQWSTIICLYILREPKHNIYILLKTLRNSFHLQAFIKKMYCKLSLKDGGGHTLQNGILDTFHLKIALHPVFTGTEKCHQPPLNYKRVTEINPLWTGYLYRYPKGVLIRRSEVHYSRSIHKNKQTKGPDGSWTSYIALASSSQSQPRLFL
jgi:hypothetical protein